LIVSDSGLDVEALQKLKKQFGDQLVHEYPSSEVEPPENLYSLDVDLLIPGARPGAIHEKNVDQLIAKWIVPIANAPVTSDAEKRLEEKGVLFIPDFVANCGGILSSAMRGDGFDLDDVRYLVATTFAELVFGLLQESASRGESFMEFARAVTWQNHLILSDPNLKTVGMRKRLPQLVKDQDWQGVRNRITYRIHRRNPQTNEAIHQSALDRYAELTLGSMIDLLESIRSHS